MASKKKGRSSGMDWDSDLDFDIPEFGSDNPAAMTDDRKPITKGIRSAVSGFGKSFTNEARLRKTLTASLPGEYAEPISKAFEIKNNVKDLYHIAGSEVSQTVRDTKRSVNRIARSLESSIPKGLYDKLMKMTAEDSGYSGQSKEEIEQSSIDSTIATIMGNGIKIDAENRKKDDARQIVQDSIDKRRHADMVTILGSVDQSLIAMQTYQEQIGTNFAKKSLEMQMRSYFVQNDTFKLQTKYFQMFKDDLSAITKNTGLPDYVKKATKEALIERMREKTFDSLATSIGKRRNEWLSGIVKKAGTKIKEVGAQARDFTGQVLDTAESMAGMAGSGLGPSRSEMAGDILGGAAGAKLQDFLAKRIKEYSERNPNVIKAGNNLSMISRNLPQWVNKQITEGKYKDKIPDFMKDILSQDGESASLQLNREVDLERATQFSDKNSQSLNIVIPQLLSKIHNELVKRRTGDDTIAPETYDYETGKFITPTERLDKLKTSIVSKKTTEQTQNQINELFKKLDPDGTKFDQATRNQISESIYKANKKGVMFDREGMMKSVDNEKMAELIRTHLGSDSSKVKENNLSRSFANVGSNNGEVRDLIQEMINNGRQGELAEIGLIDLKTGRINYEAVRKLELGIKQDTTNTVASALGNVFNGGRVQAFAKGGVMKNKSHRNKVINRPTTFPMPDGNTGLMGEAGPEAIMPLDRDEHGRLGVKTDGESTKTLIEIRDILKRIEEKGGMGMMSPEQLAEYIKTHATGIGGKLGNFARGAFGKAKDLVTRGNSFSWNMAKKGFGLATDAGKTFGQWATKKKESFDLYLNNELSPRLTQSKLEAGKYMDVLTGKIITKYSEITGDIRDMDTGEIVLKADELKNIIMRNIETGKSKLGSAFDIGVKAGKSAINAARASIRQLGNFAGSIYSIGFNQAKKAYQFLTDGPMDVYIKDNYTTPVLLKRIMSQGLYFDQTTLDSISKVSDIKGAVVDNSGNVVLTTEDLRNGLFDKNGQEIKTGFDRIKQMVGNSISTAVNMHKKLLGKAKDLLAGGLNKAKGLVGGDGKLISIGGSANRTNDILSAIYQLLNDRMPGEKHPDLANITPDTPGTKLKTTASSVAEKFKEMKDKSKSTLERLYQSRGVELKDKVSEQLSDKKDKLSNFAKEKKDQTSQSVDRLCELMKERLPEAKKKVFGDSDGDGIRDNSFEDLRNKRKQLTEKAQEKLSNAKEAAKGSSIYASLANLFKKKQSDEETQEDEGGLGLDDFIGDGGNNDDPRDAKRKRRLARARANRPRGRLGKLADKAGNLIKKIPGAGKIGQLATRFGGSAAGRGLGMVGRGVMGMGRGALSLLGGNVLGGVGRLALGAGGTMLGGAVSSAGLLTGGIGMLGSVLGMAGTGLAAILSSPITVPALALAATAGAGYMAYKWFTKPDPQPIEKVRLVQYGFKANDIDAYKQIKQLESKVASAVKFKGSNAEFDPTKLNIQDCMKIFSLDEKSREDASRFVEWFSGRFRPIYLNHRALIKTTNSPKPLENVDDNDVKFKTDYLNQCTFPGEHYSFFASPIKDKPTLSTGASDVDNQIKIAKEDILKAGDKKPEDKKDPKAASTLAAVAAAKTAQEAEAKKKADEANKPVDPVPPLKVGTEQRANENLKKLAFGGVAAGVMANGPGDGLGGIANKDGTPTSTPKTKPGVKPKSGDAAIVKSELIKQMPKFGITTPNQQAALLGNVEHESGFQPISENLNYKPQTMVKLWPNRFKSVQEASAVASKGPEGIANSIYGNRMGNTDPNDGWDYRGRGPIQITGKSNYAAISRIIGKDIVDDPDKLITDPKVSAESAIAYWKMNPQLAKNADAGNFAKVRQLINGGTIGQEDAIEKTMSYLNQLKEGSLDISGNSTPPGTVVASPKPTPSIQTDSKVPTNALENNPNTGPTPEAYSSPKPGTTVSSPKPTTAYTAPVATVKSGSTDSFYQKQSSINTGDSISIMTKTNEEIIKHTSLLERIAIGVEKLPELLSKAMPNYPAEANQVEEAKVAPVKESKPLANPSQAFRRSLAGI